ncbi:hypothetical protein ACS0TY_017792 [Phlomoides rotata]
MIDANDDVGCRLCGQEDESVVHLFFECEISYPIWSLCYLWLGIASIMSNNPKLHLLQHMGVLGMKRKKYVMECIRLCVIWFIWKTKSSYFQRRIS